MGDGAEVHLHISFGRLCIVMGFVLCPKRRLAVLVCLVWHGAIAPADILKDNEKEETGILCASDIEYREDREREKD